VLTAANNRVTEPSTDDVTLARPARCSRRPPGMGSSPLLAGWVDVVAG
jgi:hypothetical protein